MPDEMRRPVGLVKRETPGWEMAPRLPTGGLAGA